MKLNKSCLVGRTPKGAHSTRGRSRHLLETPFSEPLLRTLLRTLFFTVKPIEKGPLLRTLPQRTPSPEPFPEPSQNPNLRTLCVAVRPLRRAPECRPPPPSNSLHTPSRPLSHPPPPLVEEPPPPLVGFSIFPEPSQNPNLS